MHVPLTRCEIAQFLRTTTATIEKLWEIGDLQRTLVDDIRPLSTLARSSIFDVIEYALCSGTLSVKMSKSDAASWVLYLSEMCDTDQWEGWSLQDRAEYIVLLARSDLRERHGQKMHNQIAMNLVSAHSALLEICVMNDQAVLCRKRQTEALNESRLGYC